MDCQMFDLEFALIDNNQFPENQTGSNIINEFAVSDEKQGIGLGVDVNDNLPELRESKEPERNQRNGRYNLRKSLAWDSAFFSNAGVLDQDELSSMMTGAEKGGKKLLPGIQEDITGSTDSISTLESDSLTLETLEEDLFVDIRASIQRSSKRVSNLTNSSTSITAKEIDSKAISSLKKEDSAAQDNIPKPGSKKSSALQTVRMPQGQPKQNIGLGKVIKQDSGRSQMTSIAKTKVGEKKPILPITPKTTSSSIPSSTSAVKRDSVGTSHVKSECGNSKLGTGTQPPKVSVLSGARRAVPKPVASSKSSLLGSSTTNRAHSTRSSTSSDNSTNTSAGTLAKSTLMAARRNPGKSSNVSTGPSGSGPKTPSRASQKNKLTSSNLSTHLMSAKISSSVSPASSISEWSSASSSSSSMINQKINKSRTSLDTGSRSADRTAGRHENQGIGLTSNSSRKSSTETGGLQGPVKASGLRMPSPKIGFFDGVKSSAGTPTGQQQSKSGMHIASPRKNGVSTSVPIRSSNSKLKSAKEPSIKPPSRKPTSQTSIEEKSLALVNVSSVSEEVKETTSSPDVIKGNAAGETGHKAEEVHGDGGIKQVVDTYVVATLKENFVDLNMYENIGPGEIKTASVEGIINASGSENIYRIGDDVLVSLDHLKKNPDPTCEGIDKENDHGKQHGEELTDDKRGVYHNGLACELLRDTPECALSFPATAACRSPFPPKNSLCDNECVEMSKELTVQATVADKAVVFLLPSSELKENS